MFNTILVPVDFTEKSITALKAATFLARKSNASIDLLHIIEVPLAVQENHGEYQSTSLSGEKYLEYLLNRGRKRLAKLCDKVNLKGINVNQKIRAEAMPEKLAELITESDYDLILVGGKTTILDNVLTKTHPEKIVELAKCPVFTINSSLENYVPQNIVLPTNLIDNYTKLIHKLKEFQKLFDCNIHIVHIHKPNSGNSPEEIDELVDIFRQKHNLFKNTTFFNYSHESIGEGILEFTKKVDGDTIALFSKHEDNFLKIIRGDVTEYLVNNSQIPVMTYNLKKIVE